MLYEYNEMELRALALGYHHGASGDLPFNSYAVGSKAFKAYEWGYENGAENYDDQSEYIDNANRSLDVEDFPEHEGLDNQDYSTDTPDEVILDEDEVTEHIAKHWNLNDFRWADDDSPIVAIQFKDGGVWEAFATAPIRLYIVNEDTPEAEIPEGLALDESGTLTYASKWARGNVQFEN